MFEKEYQDYLRKYIELENGIPFHIVSIWSGEDGFCLGQKAVSEKSNEITAIPELLGKIQIKGQIVTIDAMGMLWSGVSVTGKPGRGSGEKGIKSLGMEEKTIRDEKGERKEYRYYISSRKMIEIMKPGLSLKKKQFVAVFC